MYSMIEQLRKKISEDVQEHVPLAQYSTFQIGGPARYFFVAQTSGDIVKAARAAHDVGLDIFLLAGGSNLVVADRGFDGLVIKAQNTVIEERAENVVYAEGGALWQRLVDFSREHALSGAEWGAGIPGTVGGAIRGNAGAFGESIHQIVTTVEVLNIDTAERRHYTNEQCGFDYRESIFKKNPHLIILSGLFQFTPGNKAVIAEHMDRNIAYRQQSQPCGPSAGCTFKNLLVTDDIRAAIKQADPEHGEEKVRGGKIGAGWFIDRAGLKGYQIGGVKVSDEHANFIVKVDESATADHVVQLISYIKQQVRDKYGVQLHEEVQYVGF